MFSHNAQRRHPNRRSYFSHNRTLLLLAATALLAGGLLVFITRTHSAPAKVDSTVSTTTSKAVVEHYGNLPLSFESNAGQVDDRVRFLSHGPGYELFLTQEGAVLTLKAPSPKPSQNERSASASESVLRLKMIGANQAAMITGQDELPGKANYLIGNDPKNWRQNVPTFAKVRYDNLYPGVNLVYYGNQRQLEYDFLVAPGADPSAVRFEILGAKKIQTDTQGNLILSVAGSTVTMHKPVVYQLEDGGDRHEIESRYEVKKNRVSFKVKKFDSTKPLVIDPILSYSTFFGPSADALAIAVDSSGNAYITGRATAGNFPVTSGSFQQASINTPDAFVTKLNATGTALVYSTYLGGSGQDVGNAIAVDAAGNAYLTGNTNSSNFPSVNAIRGISGNFLNSSDSGAHWNSSLIGPANANVNVLVVDPLSPNTIYAGTGFNNAGVFKSTDGGSTWNALNTGVSNANCPALAINPVTPSTLYASLVTNGSGSGLYRSTDSGASWSIQTTGLSGVTVSALTVDPTSPTTVYAGATFNPIYKSTNGGASWVNSSTGLNFGGTSAVVVDPSNPSTVYASAGGGGVFKSTNGGGNWGQVNSGLTTTTIRTLTIDGSNLYAGSAGGSVFRTQNGGGSWTQLNNGLPQFTFVGSVAVFQSTIYMGTTNGRIYKSTNDGANWSTIYDTLTQTSFNALVIKPGDTSRIYAGINRSGSQLSDSEAFVSKLNPTGSALLFSTYLGGTGDDFGNAIAVEANASSFVVAGQTASTSFPVPNAFQGTLNGTNDAFVTKFSGDGTNLIYSTYLGGGATETASGVALDQNGAAYVTGNTFSTNFPLMNAFQSVKSGSFEADAFVTKLNSNGALSYSTYLGGNGTDSGFGIAADSAGAAYVTGVTTSTDFPTANPIQSTNGGSAGDAFVTKLGASGSSLTYSTYLGGANTDSGRGIALDSGGNAYITGITGSTDFPIVAGALRTKSPFFKSTDNGVKWGNDNYGLKAPGINSLALDPQQPSTLYAGSFNGVFKSTNGGRTWSAMNAGLTNLAIREVLVDPITPANIYASADDVFSNNNGIFRSTDGGASWSYKVSGMNNRSVLALAMDPNVPMTLYAGTYGGPVYKTTDGANTWLPAGNPSISFAVSLSVDPFNSSTIFAADNSSGGGIHRSTNGGNSWQVLDLGVPTPSGSFVAASPVTSGTVFASTNAGLFKSVNGGTSWTVSRPTGAFSKVVFDPADGAVIYLLSTSEGLLKSIDSGQSWNRLTGFKSNFVTALAINPTNPSSLAAAGGSSSDDDAFVCKLNASGTALTYSTFLGGSPAPNDSLNINDAGLGIAVDAQGRAYVTGLTRSPDFPTTPGVFQPLPAGSAFISKLAPSYVISGVVTNENSSPAGGVMITLSGPQLTQVTTEGDGSYSFSSLQEGDSFTVSAAKPNFTFTPASQTFNNINSNQIVNFVAHPTNAPFFTISGKVSSNGTGLSGATVTLSGSQPGLTTTNANGDYSFTLAGGGNYTITPTLLGYSFNPPSQTLNNLSANQVADFTGTHLNLVVTTSSDSGVGSLRQALLDANAILGPDNIVFNIPGSGPRTINLSIPLPEITETVVIDATSQPDYSGTPLIELNGAATGGNGVGFSVSANNCVVRGFVINRFNGFAAMYVKGNGTVIQGNYIGTDPTGTIGRANSYGILMANASNTQIGGVTPAQRNLISGNSFTGIEVNGPNNKVQGNYIGMNAQGTAALPNGINGISMANPQTVNNLIGGTANGAGNLISGNQRGISVIAPGNVIQGNLIGTDLTGTLKVGNGSGIEASGANTLIGGSTPAARNIISGNGQGVSFGGSGSRLQGNFIGTDITGTVALGNTGDGVVAGNGALIGGTRPEERNVISCNGGFGNISLGSNNSGSAAVVRGNYIGTDVTGNVALSNPSAGISISGSNNIIGGVVPGSRNIISGNRNGIALGGSIFPGPTGNLIQGNYIGLNTDGTQALPNSLAGISISGTNNNTVGGTDPRARNRIANSGGAGIQVTSGATGNLIRGNSIVSNGGLGIDLLTNFPGGVTNNDSCDTDSGPNNFQNYPTISSAVSTNTSTTVQGTLNSLASTTFTLEFFANASCDGSGFGEAQQSLSTTVVTTESNCLAGFIVNLPFAIGGQFITATATDPNGNTSEISNCFSVSGPAGPTVQFESATYSVNEASTRATITVTRGGDTSTAVSVDYSTSDDTARQSSDYSVASGTINFAAGEVSRTFGVLISMDAYTEGNENLNLTLTNPTGGATLGTRDTAILSIIDDATVPPSTQPIDDTPNFVSQHYHDFLSRVPDGGGFTFWTQQITQCGSDQACIHIKRIDVSNAFFYELEFQQTGAYVYRLYRIAFGNNQPFPNPNPDPNHPNEEKKLPGYQAFVQDRARVIGGSQLAQNQLNLANVFVQRPEFLAKYPATLNGPAFVDAVLATINTDLGVDLSAQRQGLIDLYNQAGAANAGRANVIYRLADDNTSTNPINNRALIDAEYNRAFVATQYFGYLRRNPDIAGFLFWLGQVSSAPLRDVPKQHAMVCSFITSAEYQQRFSSVVTHSNVECSP